MPLTIPEETHDKFKFSASGDTVVLKGEIDVQDPGIILNPFFNKVLTQMDNSVRIDITELDFLNSSGIKVFVSFIMKKQPDAKVIIKVDKSKTWQMTSVEVVQSLDENNIILES